MAAELRNSRELALTLFKRDIKAQFRQSVLGYAWLFFPPIGNTLVWIFLNRSGVVQVADTGMPYPAFVMIGILLWQAFLDSLTKPINSLNAAKSMLVKLNFPRIARCLPALGKRHSSPPSVSSCSSRSSSTSACFISKLTDCDGESNETDSSLDFARDCEYITNEEYQEIAEMNRSVGRMLGSMLKNPESFLLK